MSPRCSLPHIALWVLTLPVRLIGWGRVVSPRQDDRTPPLGGWSVVPQQDIADHDWVTFTSADGRRLVRRCSTCSIEWDSTRRAK